MPRAPVFTSCQSNCIITVKLTLLYEDCCCSKLYLLQGDQKVSVRLMITIQKVTSNVQSVPRQSPDIY
jgi:hypothetical protein